MWPTPATIASRSLLRTAPSLREWGSSCELYAEGQPGCVDPDGAGPLQLGDGQMREPWGIAVAPDGKVYVADTWNHRVLAFDGQGNSWTSGARSPATNGEAGGSPGGFWGPRAIAVDGAGNLYVTDTGNKRIQVFDPTGVFLGQYGGGGVVEGRFDEPVGLAITPRWACPAARCSWPTPGTGASRSST